ncbi:MULTISPECIES: hypothetical protein [Alicyclobacillus]|uniref:Uncharacterized protein n=1 Tax=Alicyclobacillus vulcanalis TaxID=252246 RepID=A0A1N7LLA5_9BACL|nr:MULTISPECIES: hypothetical protein [Alicyclobacillus]SIS74623.1 hypothetical protein SAMN05421799_103230 [Alicyclobacillus vulcanalis]
MNVRELRLEAKSRLSARYHRIAARRGTKRAAFALAHPLLVIVYHLLKDKTEYRDLGPDSYGKQNRDALIRRHVRRLKELGVTVIVTEEAS